MRNIESINAAIDSTKSTMNSDNDTYMKAMTNETNRCIFAQLIMDAKHRLKKDLQYMPLCRRYYKEALR